MMKILMDNFRDALDICELVDLKFREPNFTYKRGADRNNKIQERLDRFVANSLMIGKTKKIRLDHLNFYNLDHRPILAWVNKGNNHKKYGLGRKGRRFEASWINRSECLEIVKSIWTNGGSYGVGEISRKIRTTLNKMF